MSDRHHVRHVKVDASTEENVIACEEGRSLRLVRVGVHVPVAGLVGKAESEQARILVEPIAQVFVHKNSPVAAIQSRRHGIAVFRRDGRPEQTEIEVVDQLLN